MARVLVVDDQPDVRFLWRTMLARDGHQIVEVTSGADALTSIASDPPDVVLLDGHLPDIAGLDVLARAGTAHGDPVRHRLRRPLDPGRGARPRLDAGGVPAETGEGRRALERDPERSRLTRQSAAMRKPMARTVSM
jgi:Response regulator receiver domain